MTGHKRSRERHMSTRRFARIALTVGILATSVSAPVTSRAAPIDSSLLPRWAALFSDVQVEDDGPTFIDPPRPVHVPANVSGVEGGAEAMGMSPDGTRMYVTGWVFEPFRGYHYLIAAYDATTGTKLWSARHEPFGEYFKTAIAYALAVSPDGSRVFVTGKNGIVAYDASNGIQLWADPSFSYANSPFEVALVVSPDGTRVYEARSSSASVAYDAATGTRLWTTPSGYDLALSPDGAIVYVQHGDGVAAYTAAGGAQLWTNSGTGWEKSVAVSPDGTRVFVSRRQAEGTDEVVALDARSGVELWTAQQSTPAEVTLRDLAVSPDGSLVYATGLESTHRRESGYITEAYDSTSGAERWVARFNRPGDTNGVYLTWFKALALAVSPDGSRVYVTGRSSVDLGVQGVWVGGVTLAYDATEGTELSAFPGGGQDLAVSPDGARLYVTGAEKTTAYCTSALTLPACLAGR
jgi:DNA-binding beta-propeller fold protein YncE